MNKERKKQICKETKRHFVHSQVDTVYTSVLHSSSSTQSWGSVLPSMLRRETRIPGVAPCSYQIGIWDLFVHRGQKSYTPTAFGKLWTSPGVRCMKHASS